jgi:hypothetical protein
MHCRRLDLSNYLKRKIPKSICVSMALAMTITMTGIFNPVVASTEHSVHWKDTFSTAEQEKLTAWVSEVATHVEALVGPLPFSFQIHFYRRDGAGEPVPWANTRRTGLLGVDFYVDPSYSLEAFRRDWTAPHEISHLILPYLGPGNAWFAEGFASFMQYQVMQSIGVLSKNEKAQRYMQNLSKASRDYVYPNRPFVQASSRLRQEGKYSVMYWGGAVYFLQVNDYLVRTQGLTLVEVLKIYTACCRRNFSSLRGLIADLDRATNSGIFASHLDNFVPTRGFPRFRQLDLAT